MNEREENELILKLIEKYNVPIGKVLVHPGREKTEDRGHSATADAEHNNGQMNRDCYARHCHRSNRVCSDQKPLLYSFFDYFSAPRRIPYHLKQDGRSPGFLIGANCSNGLPSRRTAPQRK